MQLHQNFVPYAMKSFVLINAILALAIICTTAARTFNKVDSVEAPELSNTIDGRIVGGKTVDITHHPHQVSMRYKSILHAEYAYSHNCGGSIISEWMVVTAAHCVIGKVASQYQIVAGTNLRRSCDGALVPVKEIIMHEDYQPTLYNNDIAIVVLAVPLPINNVTIKAIGLYNKPAENGVISTITGWGTLQSGGSSPYYLQEVQVPIVSNELCKEDYGTNRITDAMLCAGVRGVGGKDACQGDSGGPLLIDNQLAGVVSWGNGCARPAYPGVYANVTHLRSWVLEKKALVESRLLLEN
ncbi:unnamed protein product [Ceratitis capitata]|uniref:(Mediterranean fruit fly) hypothetical protein n=1 Tax=Ceratitis capitata TaxID=7213 RepID=A0A811VEE2_CERCA|nr:unnamed protein product [Ceratitis capitata]